MASGTRSLSSNRVILLLHLLPFALMVTIATVALKSLLPYALWVGYSAIISRLTGNGLQKALKDDAKTYVAAAPLLFLPLTALINVPAGLERFAYLPAAIILIISISAFIALKAYFLFGIKNWPAPYSIRKAISKVMSINGMKIAWAAAAIYTALFAALSVAKHYALNTRGIDLGIFDQTLWGMAHNKVLFSTVVGDYLFGYHSFFLFFPLALIYKLLPRVELLLILQSLVIGLGAVPLYSLAKKSLGKGLALAVLAAYLIYPALNYITLEDFHSEAFAVTALLAALYFLEQKKEAWFLLMVGITALIKEDTALTAAALGVYAALVKRRWKAGALAIIISVAIFFIATKLFIPHYSQTGTFQIGGFGDPGDTPFEVLKNSILYPLATLTVLAKVEKLAYGIMLLTPIAGLALLAPALLLGGIPAIAINLLSSSPQRYSIYFHYNANLIPFIFLALIGGLTRAQAIIRKVRSINFRQAKAAVTTLLVSTAVLSAYFYGPLPGTKSFSADSYDFSSEDAKAGRELIAKIPGNASVSATNTAVPHLSQREYVYVFPNPFHKAWYLTDNGREEPEYVLLGMVPGREGIYTSEEFTSYVTELINNRSYGITTKNGQWLLLKKGADYEKGICNYYAEIRKEKFINVPLTSENSNIIDKC